MVRSGNWFSSVKKTLSPASKNKSQKSNKSKYKRNHVDANSSFFGGITAPTLISQHEEVSVTLVENEQVTHAYSGENSCVFEAAVVPDQVASGVIRPSLLTQFAGKSKEEVAAIKIQMAFRGYLARRVLRGLRGLARFKLLIEGPAVKSQTANALRYLKTLSYVQSQIYFRRIKMLEESQALQRQLLQKQEKELASLQMPEEWDDSLQSKEETEAKLLSKYEAARRRERALAYSFSHQPGKNPSKSGSPMIMDPGNPHWGWGWLERRVAACPWESRILKEKEFKDDQSSMRSSSDILVGEISKAYARHQLNSNKLSAADDQKLSNHSSHCSSSSPRPIVTRKPKHVSPKMNPRKLDIDSNHSIQPEQHRKNTIIVGSLARDDVSQESSLAVPSYMVPTESAKAKLLASSPAGLVFNGTPDKKILVPVKKQLGFSSSPRTRRHSGPPAVGRISKAEHI